MNSVHKVHWLAVNNVEMLAPHRLLVFLFWRVNLTSHVLRFNIFAFCPVTCWSRGGVLTKDKSCNILPDRHITHLRDSVDDYGTLVQ